MSKHFYESSGIVDFDSNITYHELLSMTEDQVDVWLDALRAEVLRQWDNEGIPPVIGRNEDELIDDFKKLRSYNVRQFFLPDPDGELGVVRNFNKDGSGVNQFFPTMLKTKISVGKSSDGGKSIYDHFKDDDLKQTFKNSMMRLVRRDAMYSYSKSVQVDKSNNPKDLPYNGESGADWLRKYKRGLKYGIWIYKWKKKQGHEDFLLLSVDEIKELYNEGVLDDSNIVNLEPLDELSDTEHLKSGKVNHFVFTIRYYDKEIRVFPKALQVFRLGLGQPAVNFPALTAKWLYEHYTAHVPSENPITVYDPSAGWGGRILGAMSCSRKLHYVGTDPNPDNFIPELGTTRYEYFANYYNDRCILNAPDALFDFFSVEDETNTFDVYREGSEVIHNNPNFQKYKGQFDFVFTSPPYFNREQYSQDESQSFRAYPGYDDWRDNFLKPTLRTAYDYLKSDRYIAWNIANIKVGKDLYYPLEDDSIKFLEEFGCEYQGKLKMLMSPMMGLDLENIPNSVKIGATWYKYEPILIFYKP